MDSRSDSGVAVLIAAYNAKDTIGRAITSALAQREVIEVCVVDDQSSDDTVSVSQACDDGSGRLKVVQQSKNAGPSAARNRAISETKAPFLAVLDSDDYLLADRMAGLLSHKHEAELIGDDLLRIDDDAMAEAPRAVWDMDTLIDVNFQAFIEGNISRSGVERVEFGFLKPLMNRAFLDAHGLRYREDLRLGEDFDLYARVLALGGRMIVMPAKGYVAVTRGDSLSGKHSELDLVRLRDAGAGLSQLRRMSAGESLALRQLYDSLECKVAWLRLIEAVKARDVGQIVRLFVNSGPVPAYLTARLAEQLVERTVGRRVKASG